MRMILAVAALAACPAWSAAAKAPPVDNPADLIVPVVNPGDYTVEVEAFRLGRTLDVKPYQFAYSAGDYVMASSTTAKKTATREKFLVNSEQWEVTVDYRFTKLDGAPVQSGRCDVKLWFILGVRDKFGTNPYACQFDGKPPQSFSLDAVVPDIAITNEDAIFSVEKNDPDRFKALKATLRYNDVVYEAVPTGLTFEREQRMRRVADGWIITRDGKKVGRIDFPSYKGVIADERWKYELKSVVTAPKAETDGREAVIFFAVQLQRLPEAQAPWWKP